MPLNGHTKHGQPHSLCDSRLGDSPPLSSLAQPSKVAAPLRPFGDRPSVPPARWKAKRGETDSAFERFTWSLKRTCWTTNKHPVVKETNDYKQIHKQNNTHYDKKQYTLCVLAEKCLVFSSGWTVNWLWELPRSILGLTSDYVKLLMVCVCVCVDIMYLTDNSLI